MKRILMFVVGLALVASSCSSSASDVTDPTTTTTVRLTPYSAGYIELSVPSHCALIEFNFAWKKAKAIPDDWDWRSNHVAPAAKTTARELALFSDGLRRATWPSDLQPDIDVLAEQLDELSRGYAQVAAATDVAAMDAAVDGVFAQGATKAAEVLSALGVPAGSPATDVDCSAVGP